MSTQAAIPIEDVVAGGPGTIRVDRRGPQGGARTPLVVLGGMTQTLASWGGQIRGLAADREVLVYEARGQGRTALAVDDVTVERHVDDFRRLLAATGLDAGPVDLCGFSFGGRVSMAIAASEPARIRRLVISGVGADRGVVGRIVVRAWNEALRSGDLETVAWLSLADTLGPAYLAKYEHMLDGMVKATVRRNTYAGVKALFDQTSMLPADSPWQTLALAPRIRCPTLLMTGALDRLAPPAGLEQLAEAFRAPVTHAVLPDVGHTIAIEAADEWRRRVLAFLDDTEEAA